MRIWYTCVYISVYQLYRVQPETLYTRIPPLFSCCVLSNLTNPPTKNRPTMLHKWYHLTSMNQGTRLATSTIGECETHVLLKCHVHLHPGNRGQQNYTLERFSQGSGRNKKNRTTTYGTPQNRRFANSEFLLQGVSRLSYFFLYNNITAMIVNYGWCMRQSTWNVKSYKSFLAQMSYRLRSTI